MRRYQAVILAVIVVVLAAAALGVGLAGRVLIGRLFAGGDAAPVRSLVVNIDASGEVSIDGQVTVREQVTPELQRLLGQTPTDAPREIQGVQVHTHGNAPTRRVVEVAHVIRQCGAPMGLFLKGINVLHVPPTGSLSRIDGTLQVDTVSTEPDLSMDVFNVIPVRLRADEEGALVSIDLGDRSLSGIDDLQNELVRLLESGTGRGSFLEPDWSLVFNCDDELRFAELARAVEGVVDYVDATGKRVTLVERRRIEITVGRVSQGWTRGVVAEEFIEEFIAEPAIEEAPAVELEELTAPLEGTDAISSGATDETNWSNVPGITTIDIGPGHVGATDETNRSDGAGDAASDNDAPSAE